MKKMEVTNRKAFHDYTILKEIECGISLKGSEVKSVRKGSIDLKEAYVVIKNNEAFLLNMYVAHYEEANTFNHEERRTRKLLIHKKEIKKLQELKEQEGISLIPIKAYFKNNHLKILIGVGKGKKLYDKREDIKKRDLERLNRREMKY